jgi:CRP-like cAMP-binding protein
MMADGGHTNALLSWMQELPPEQLTRVHVGMVERHFSAGEKIFRRGARMACWAGVADGVLKLSRDTPSGKTIATFPCVTRGSWLGEDALLRQTPLQYDVVALRATRLVLVARTTFLWLLSESFAFNCFVMEQMSARLRQFADRIEIDRLRDPETSVARCLAALLNGADTVGCAQELRISQGELGLLAGTSRQRANVALQRLQRERLLSTHNGKIRVFDPQRLRAYGDNC